MKNKFASKTGTTVSNKVTGDLYGDLICILIRRRREDLRVPSDTSSGSKIEAETGIT